MITELQIRNFKSVKAADLKCNRVNILIGKPNTGKSNILETIALMNFFADRYIIKLNNRKDKKEDLSFVFRISRWSELFRFEDILQPITVEAVTDSEERIKVQLRYNETAKRIEVTSKERNIASLNPAHLGYALINGTSYLSPIVRFGFYRFRLRKNFPSKEIRFVVPPDAPNLLEVIRIRRKEMMAEITQLLCKYGVELTLELSSGSMKIQQTLGEEEIPLEISLLYSVLSDTLKKMIFNLAIVSCNEKMVIAIEEPETHMFPFYVKYLAEKIAQGNKGNQYFISTHNPYFLISLLEKAPKKDVNVFVTSTERNETRVRMLTDEQKEEILNMDLDVFFNLDKFWEELSREIVR